MYPALVENKEEGWRQPIHQPAAVFNVAVKEQANEEKPVDMSNNVYYNPNLTGS